MDIDHRLPYRIGSPVLPVLPVITKFLPKSIDQYFPSYEANWREIEKILHKSKIKGALMLCLRLHEGDQPQEHHVTLVVVSTANQHSQQVWLSAVLQLRMYLNDLKLQNLAVEIIDKCATQGLHMTIWRPDNTTINFWNSKLPAVIAHFEERDWVSVDVQRREHPFLRPSPVSIVICARDADNPVWWNTILPNIRSMLQQDGQDQVQIVILFLNQLLYLDHGHTKPDMDLLKKTYNEADKWLIGASCSRSGSRSSGTLGGRVVLQDKDKKHYFGLTNWHVVQDKGEPDKPTQDIQVSIPSDQDHKLACKEHKCRVKEAKKEYRMERKKVEERGIRSGRLDTIKCLFEMENEQKANIQVFERTAGNGFTGARNIAWKDTSISDTKDYGESDLKNLGKPDSRGLDKSNMRDPSDFKCWIIDWCLFETGDKRTVSPKVACQLKRYRAEIDLDEYGSISRTVGVFDVAKLGRSSAWTQGTTSSIRSEIRLLDSAPMEEAPGPVQMKKSDFREEPKDTPKGQTLFCYGIISKNPGKEFLESGDSGAFVILDPSIRKQKPTVVGLGFSGNQATNISYMMPMDLVIKSIEEKTGCKVVEPTYCKDP
ncbi:hypothetical protein P154DRAFT_591218 [Amniculicola lignicola CBS 123094]|uniref:Uncharacterized protein n=1 Tax=Amniculicola lignicola CBS 123094 TaxID=1392246 RepID=A0A6A5WQY4_9PLEO|nr:hypothetical protein P154DRAFT_591218 [Amniculicola lignicola CBS 123094]